MPLHSPVRKKDNFKIGSTLSSKRALYPPSSEKNGIVPPSQQPDNKFKTESLPSLTGNHFRTNDDIHTTIFICPATKVILDTPQVQRLRSLKQLGATEFTYINAKHTRFEHSLGVMHLAEKMVRNIQSRQPRLRVSEKDVLCVKLAGLCHDLGHGPFSHVFDGAFDFRHEDASLMMLDAALAHLGLAIDKTRLDEPLKQIGDGLRADCFGACGEFLLKKEDVLTSRDGLFIKECILGEPLEGYSDFVGRGGDKEFLYDVVNNRHSGLDVDKIDYYARDKQRVMGGTGEMFHMLVEEAFVAWGTCPNPTTCFKCKHLSSHTHHRHLMIAYPDKLVIKAMEFFKTRFSLHANIYTHKTSRAVEYMIADILKMADPHLLLPNLFNPPVCISQSMHAPNAYLNLNDSIIDHIALSMDPKLHPSQSLIKRLQSRKLYKCAHVQPIYDSSDNDIWESRINKEHQIQHELANIKWCHAAPDGLLKLKPEHIRVEMRTIHHGRKSENPVNLMRFLPKNALHCCIENDAGNLPEAIQVQEENYASHIPRNFWERTIRIFVTHQEVRDLAKHAFEQWWEKEKSICAKTVEDRGYDSPRMLTQDGSDDDNEDALSDNLGVLGSAKRSREYDYERDDDELPAKRKCGGSASLRNLLKSP